VISFLIRRCLASLLAIFGVSLMVFLLIHFIPGDPVDLLLGEAASAQDKMNYRKILGLNLPLYEQYFLFVKNLFSTWGYSFSRGGDVLPLIWSRFPSTLVLAVSGLVMGLLMSLPVGIYTALKKDTLFERILSVGALSGMSLPIFILAPLLTLFFAIRLKWFPVAGYGTFSHLVLPSFALGLGLFGVLTRMIRSSFLDVLGEDYLRTARAKGLSPIRIVGIHAMKNALIPVVTMLGNIFGGLLAGAVLTETLFDWPGIGKLFYSAFQSRDYALIQGIVLWISLSYFLVNLLVDFLYFIIDPRIQINGNAEV